MGLADYVLGVDLGGTNVSVAAVGPDGTVGAGAACPIRAAEGPGKGLETIAALMEGVAAAEGGRPRGYGVGATGPVDIAAGRINNPYTLPGWQDVDILGYLGERLGLPGSLENDADAFALGEWWAGGGRGSTRLFAMTVGTGVGTAFVADGRVWRGAGGVHPEGGHMIVDFSYGEPCYCGSPGCLEQLAAGPAIGALARAYARERGGLMVELAGGDIERIGAREAASAARRGDPAAAAVVEKAGAYLGAGLVNAMQLLFPDRVVLGGGVMNDFDVFEPAMRRVVERADVMVPTRLVVLSPSKLGRKAGMIGAARSAYALLEET